MSRRVFLVVSILLGCLFNLPGGATSPVVLSEFMAANTRGLADEDGDFPDWIELRNTTNASVDLGGWSLSDDPANLRKWQFPPTFVEPGGYLIVFASGKDRRSSNAALHTNFKLDASGEFLALTEPDGVTVATAYTPSYPPQVPDVSFGLDPGLRLQTMLSARAPGRFLIPASDALGTNWILNGFDDSGWTAGTAPFGYSATDIGSLPLAGLTNGLVGYWRFNETNGNLAFDASGRGNTGILLNFPTNGSQWGPGIQGGALRLRGAPNTDFVRVPNYPKASNALSAAAWVWADGRPVWASIAKNWANVQGQFHFGLRDTGGDLDIFIHTSAGDFSVREGNPLPLGAWQHVAFTATNGLLRLYRNGQLVGSGPYTGNFVNPPLPALGIGVKLNATGTGADSSAPGYWQGQIDDLGIWNRALDPTEIQALAASATALGSSILTDLRPAMLGQNASCYLRFAFTVDNPDQLTRWLLKIRYDDGLVAWLNGTEILRRLAPDDLHWDSKAVASRPDPDAAEFEVLNLAAFTGVIQPGSNVLAIQALNAQPDDLDLFLQPILEASSIIDTTNAMVYFTTPTPGAENIVGVSVLGPIIQNLNHQPAVPSDEQDLLVTARVAPAFAPITNVTLRYRIMFSNEVAVPMFDDGAHGDGTAGDGIYGASIPATASNPGQMLRYAVLAADALGRTNREPLFSDPLGSPQYRGTLIRNAGITSALPVLHWFVGAPAAAETDLGTRCSIFSPLGEFYDNVFVRIRGGTARGWPKKSYKIELNEGDHYLLHPGAPRVSEFDLNATYTDKAYVRAVLTAEHQEAAGVPAPETFHVQLRQNGAFYSVALFVEQPDRDFLRGRGMDPEGSLYKCGPGSTFDSVAAFEKKTRRTEDKSDAQALLSGLALNGPALETFVFDNFDIPAVINFLATVAVTQNIDASDKNLFLYRDTNGTKEWRLLPWDLDLTFGPDALNTDTIVTSAQNTNSPACASHPFIGARPYLLSGGKYNRMIEAIVNTPRTRVMLLRRVRTLTDQFLATTYFQDRIEQFYAYLTPDVQADRTRWGVSAHFPGTTYTFRAALDRIRNEYLTPRLPYLTGLSIAGVGPANPASQPFNCAVRLGPLDVNPASGNQAEEFLSLTNESPFPVDVSGWKIRGGVEFTLKPGTVIPSNEVLYLSPNVTSFRARSSGPRGGQRLLVQGNYQGQLSARGEPLRLLDAAGLERAAITNAPNASAAQQFLRITELMYHPAPLGPATGSDPEAYEYIELRNISTTTTLDLTGVRFTAGVQFSFSGSAVTTLGPGARVVVVKNAAAFASRYGTLAGLAGQYLGALENGGERLQLVDAANEEILDFRYDNRWYPVTDGLGFSLVAVDENAAPDQWASAQQWRPSGQRQGSPAAADPPTPVFPRVWINEALTHTEQPPPTDSIELFNAGGAPAEIGGWFLTDDFNTPKKFRLPLGSVLAPGGYRVFSEADFNPTPGVPPSFSLGADGDEVWLFSADAGGELTGYVHGFRFGPAESGVSFGRLVSSEGRVHFVAETAPTLGASNAGPRVGPLVFSEILYHPPRSGTNDSDLSEFIEILNVSNATVPLYDPIAPTNTWRVGGGVRFVFPPEQQLAAGATLLLVNFDPAVDTNALASFRVRYHPGATVPILGPYGGVLNDDEDSLELTKPILLNGSNLVQVLIDAVNYADSAPWPELADGTGLSLQRRSPTAYGNDPANWFAGAPTAGAAPANGTAPTFLVQPQSMTVPAFSSLTLSVMAGGSSPLRYQWQRNGENLPGATNAMLQFSNVPPEAAGSYQVIVYNEAGSVASSDVTLTLILPPALLRAPISVSLRGSTNAIDYGSTTNRSASFNVTAYSPSPLSYQWRFNGAPIPGAINPTLSVTNVTVTDDGWYDVVVSDPQGSVTSPPARLLVLLNPLIVVAPRDQAVGVGGSFTASLVVKGNPPPFYFQFRHTSSNLASFVSESGTNFFTRSNLQTNHGGLYRIIVTNAASPTATIAASFNVTILADADGDGLPDLWEQNFFGGPTNADPDADADGDGSLNWQEYVAGTDPTDPQSYLRLESLNPVGTVLTFQAVSNLTYAIEYTDGLAVGSRWLRLADIPARPSSGPVQVSDAHPHPTHRLYRLVTPRMPAVP